MKNYSNYIFEAKNPDFNIAYDNIENTLDLFWIALDDSLDTLGKIKTRDPDEVSRENSKASEPAEPAKLVMPISGETYNYITKGDTHEVVVIINPEISPNVAQVKCISPTPVGSGIHTAEWSRLVPNKKGVPVT